MPKVKIDTIDLNGEDACRSLRDEVYRVPFINAYGDRIFVACTKMSGDSVTMEMEDGTSFVLTIKKVKPTTEVRNVRSAAR